jgi:heme-degrading monooxygenase HmoA
MIARLWHGAVPAEKGDAYHEFLLRTGVTDYKATPGNLGVHVFRRIEGDRAHFLLTSFWESEEAIRRFAGDDIEKARYIPEDSDYLLELEPSVIHYEVLEADLTRSA